MRPSPTCSEQSSYLSFLLMLLPCFQTESVALGWTSAHYYLLGLPVNLWVVLWEPGETEDDVLFSEAGDCKEVHSVCPS